MAVTTKIIVQQILNIDDTKATASKFPRYTVTLGNSISSITASELVSSIEAAAKSAAAAKDSEIAAKTSELNAKNSEQEAAISAGASEASATQSAISATQSAASADRSAESAAAAKVSETNANASETNAKASETNAAASASDSRGYRDEAEIFSTQAAASASAAKTSETNAKTSETNAKTSETKAKDSETNAASSATSASQSVTTIQGLKSDVEQLKSDTQLIKDSAVGETTALKADVEKLKSDTQTIKDSAVSETQAIKDAAVSETTALKDAAAASAAQASNSAAEAGQQASNAAGSAQSASTDAGRAEVAAGKAEQVISQALLKDNNLSDLTNIGSARSVLKIDRIDQTEHESRLKSTQDKQYLFVNTNNLNIPGSSAWGVYNTERGMIPLTIECGGTGARQPDHVRINLDVPSNAEAFLIKNNLSEITDKNSAWKNVRPEGSLPLSGDPVNDYDATTQRWVRNLFNIGTVGPTMNGVMNYGVGDFHLRDSRAYIQPYEVVSDGQLLERELWPELWAYAQMLSPISDEQWLADPHQRGKYSLGNGSTTFRVPDRNGVQGGSIPSLYGRGDGIGNGSANSGADGQIFDSAAPNITGTITMHGAQASGAGATSLQSLTGAFRGLEVQNRYNELTSTASSVARSYGVASLDASRSNSVYGRSDNEIMGRNFVGVWVIRASGGFVAANTSWSVINSDAVRPGSGVRAYSGQVKAQYKIGTVVEADAGLRCDAYMDGLYYAILSVYNKTKGVTKELAFDDTGTLNSDRYSARYGTMMAWSETGFVKGTFRTEEQAIGTNYAFNSILSGSQYSNAGYKTSAHFGLIHNDLGSFADSCWHVSGDADNKYGVRLKIQPNNNSIYFYSWWPNGAATYTLQLNAISDSRLKHDIKAIDATKSIEVLKGLEFQSFIYNNDEKSRIRRGVIAQQVETIEPLYVKTRRFYNDDGVEQEQKELDTTPMLLDTMHVVQDLIKRIEDLEEELKQLRANLVQ